MVRVGFYDADGDLQGEIAVRYGQPVAGFGDLQWLDMNRQPWSERLGAPVRWEDDPEEWARSLPAALAAEGSHWRAQILQDSAAVAPAPSRPLTYLLRAVCGVALLAVVGLLVSWLWPEAEPQTCAATEDCYELRTGDQRPPLALAFTVPRSWQPVPSQGSLALRSPRCALTGELLGGATVPTDAPTAAAAAAADRAVGSHRQQGGVEPLAWEVVRTPTGGLQASALLHTPRADLGELDRSLWTRPAYVDSVAVTLVDPDRQRCSAQALGADQAELAAIMRSTRVR